MINRSTQPGFTLIEMMLYVAISSVMLLSLSIFLASNLQTARKQEVAFAVESEATRLTQWISREIQTAQAIIDPTSGQSASQLTLRRADNSTVQFTVADNHLRVGDGSTSTDALLPRIQITSFAVTTMAGDVPYVFVTLTLKHDSQSGRNEFKYEREIEFGATLRSAI